MSDTEDLATWLRAQVTAASARTSGFFEQPHGPGCGITADVSPECDCNYVDTIRAQCEAQMRVLNRHHPPRPGSSEAAWMGARSCGGCGVTGDPDCEVTEDINECPELLDMAVAFRHQPGYREGWAPRPFDSDG